MQNPWKNKVLAFNAKRKEQDEKAFDLMILLESMPPGQRKQLRKNATCAAILEKYGINE